MGNGSDIITIEILGTRLQLRGGDHPEAVRQASELVKRQVEDLRSKAPNAPVEQLALLTAINLADEYIKAHEQKQAVDEALERANRILSRTQVT